MNNSCDTCKHASAKLEHFPCRACAHSYIDRWEKATFDDLNEPMLTLDDLYYYLGARYIHDAVEICKAVIKLIEEE